MTATRETRAPLPTAWLVVGPAGSGKSTLARTIAARYRCGLVDKDRLAPLVEEALRAHGEPPADRETSTFYRSVVMPLEYRSLFLLTGDGLGSGVDVVVDAPFAGLTEQDDFLERMRTQAGWPPARVVLVRASAASGVVRERVRARGLRRDGAKLAAWDEFWARYGDTPCLWRGVDRQVEVRTDAPELDLTSLDAVAGTLAP